MLRRFVATAIVAPLALACTEPTGPTADSIGIEAAASATPESAVVESVTGSAHFLFFTSLPPGLGTRKLTFTANKKADGTVQGEWNIVVGASILHGDLDCLTILPGGNRARVSGIVEDAKFTSFIPGTAFAMEFVDNGQGQAVTGDEASGLLAFRNADPQVGRTFCETGVAPGPVSSMEMEKGNFQIRSW